MRKNGLMPGKHVIYEQKVVCPVSTGQAGTADAGARAGFGNTADHWRGIINGDYAYALSRGHSVHAIIHETFGGFEPEAVALLYELGRRHGSRLGVDESAAPWCARSFRSLHALKISVAIHTAAASEILETAQADAAAEAAAHSES